MSKIYPTCALLRKIGDNETNKRSFGDIQTFLNTRLDF